MIITNYFEEEDENSITRKISFTYKSNDEILELLELLLNQGFLSKEKYEIEKKKVLAL